MFSKWNSCRRVLDCGGKRSATPLSHCTVWFNGTVVARNWCGYTSCYIDITPMAQYSDSLSPVVVRVDANDMEGWWYEGAGIYRHTWLVKRNSVHLITDGVYANPMRAADGSWSLPVEATLENSGREDARRIFLPMLAG